MAFISVTRLRVRSLRYLPAFLWRTQSSVRQAQRAAGFIGGRVLVEARWTFWTTTAWEDEAAMRAFRGSGAHKAVMPKLLEWCDEASVAHWRQDGPEVPDWQSAHQQMITSGRPSKVNHPSEAHDGNRIPAPRPSRITRELKPI